jgi:hypothetical protein
MLSDVRPGWSTLGDAVGRQLEPEDVAYRAAARLAHERVVGDEERAVDVEEHQPHATPSYCSTR